MFIIGAVEGAWYYLKVALPYVAFGVILIAAAVAALRYRKKK